MLEIFNRPRQYSDIAWKRAIKLAQVDHYVHESLSHLPVFGAPHSKIFLSMCLSKYLSMVVIDIQDALQLGFSTCLQEISEIVHEPSPSHNSATQCLPSDLSTLTL